MDPEITVVNLPSPFLEEPMWIYPLGVINFVTYLKCRGYSAELLDLEPFAQGNRSLNGQIVQLLRTIKSPIVGVSATTPQARFLSLFPTAFGERKVLVVGGPHASVAKFELNLFGFNVVAGEADSDAVVDTVISSKNYTVYAEPVEDLDKLPFPDRSLVKNYKGPIPVMVHRGCPYSCVFCSKTLDKRVRMRSPENIVEELKELDKKYPDKSEVIFYDETFTLNYDWTDKLCELIRSSNLKKKFRCSTRSDRLTLEVADNLKSAGFEEVCIGVESGSDEILKTLKKGTTVEQNSKAVDICRKVGLKFKAYIMIGSPGESFDTLNQTYFWIKNKKPDSIGLYLFTPLPGSDVWNHRNGYDIKFSDLDYDRAYYGGKRSEMMSMVSTKALTRQDITKFYWKMLSELYKLY